jgi:steroid Delta-isomerase
MRAQYDRRVAAAAPDGGRTAASRHPAALVVAAADGRGSRAPTVLVPRPRATMEAGGAQGGPRAGGETMAGPAREVIERFGAVEQDQRYTALADQFTDDATYYDPFLGAQVGRAAIEGFLAHMERLVPKTGTRFESWESQGDTTCGWSRWVMTMPRTDGERVPLPGQSLYRLRDGKVCFAADYIDPRAWRRFRAGGPQPAILPAQGLGAPYAPEAPAGEALALVRRFWEIQDAGARYTGLVPLFADDAVFEDLVYGRFEGIDAIRGYLARMEREMPEGGITFHLVDAAGDETLAWSQWTCRLPGGDVPGWTLHLARDGRLTLDADYFDLVAAALLPR